MTSNSAGSDIAAAELADYREPNELYPIESISPPLAVPQAEEE